jgi:hypothetical protein
MGSRGGIFPAPRLRRLRIILRRLAAPSRLIDASDRPHLATVTWPTTGESIRERLLEGFSPHAPNV